MKKYVVIGSSAAGVNGIRELRKYDKDAEIVLITPHFVHGMPRDHDNRPYVANLKRFAEKHDLALADASARWAHLWREGLPYITLLANNWNHPDDRGHRLFAEELIKCFEP